MYYLKIKYVISPELGTQAELHYITSNSVMNRAAKSVGIWGLDPTIAKDLNDSEDPKHTLFCREIAFVAIYALFGDDISIFW